MLTTACGGGVRDACAAAARFHGGEKFTVIGEFGPFAEHRDQAQLVSFAYRACNLGDTRSCLLLLGQVQGDARRELERKVCFATPADGWKRGDLAAATFAAEVESACTSLARSRDLADRVPALRVTCQMLGKGCSELDEAVVKHAADLTARQCASGDAAACLGLPLRILEYRCQEVRSKAISDDGSCKTYQKLLESRR